MIVPSPSVPRPLSVQSLNGGSPILKTQQPPEKIKEDPRGINTDLPLTRSHLDQPSYLSPIHQPSARRELVVPDNALFDNVPSPQAASLGKSQRTSFQSLPFEIHEEILDHLLGAKACVKSPCATSDSSPTTWIKAPRFSRRKELTDLALVCKPWRQLVQARVYRQITLKGTNTAMLECRGWFIAHRHLARFVRVIEIWIPIWGERIYTPIPHVRDRRPSQNRLISSRNMGWEDPEHPIYDIPFLASGENATLEEIFQHLQLFRAARVLILQGGHAKNSPQVRYFLRDNNDEPGRSLPRLPQIRTLVMRGAWNLVRRHRHWSTISRALPALEEWHSIFPTSRSEVEFLVAKIINRPPVHLRHANLNIEGTGIGDRLGPYHRLYPEVVCTLLGYLAMRLETLAFTGKICDVFFTTLRELCESAEWPPCLRSLDLSVISCCPDLTNPIASTEPIRGIRNLEFIYAFEAVVIEAIRCLQFLPSLTYVNIRFLDVSPICPQVKPYFNLTNNKCSGIWSSEILSALRQSRPAASYVELTDGIVPDIAENGQVLGITPVARRPVSINARMYDYIAH